MAGAMDQPFPSSEKESEHATTTNNISQRMTTNALTEQREQEAPSDEPALPIAIVSAEAQEHQEEILSNHTSGDVAHESAKPKGVVDPRTEENNHLAAASEPLQSIQPILPIPCAPAPHKITRESSTSLPAAHDEHTVENGVLLTERGDAGSSSEFPKEQKQDPAAMKQPTKPWKEYEEEESDMLHAYRSDQTAPLLTAPAPSSPSSHSLSSTPTKESSPEPTGIVIDVDKLNSSLQEKWDEMFERLVEYKKIHGNCLVPNRYSDDPALGAWVSTQRRQYKVLRSGTSQSTPMTPERALRLASIGFVWTAKDPRHVAWEVRYRELVAYRNEHGMCDVNKALCFPFLWRQRARCSISY